MTPVSTPVSDPSFGPQFRTPVSGGTSLFDVKSVFKGKSWLCFEIPEGTVIPASLVVRETGYNPRLKANHYQIECAAKSLRIYAFKGAVDNLARNAIARAVQRA
ncbi:hypothetical protein [Rhodanobacter sp. Root627]|uniref:Tse2 family ADP-ribosyltransferase toxin n=1 Tax=Rhodanobacter sp. Root627 TaxID=1736572 RepID=UPI002100C450|nr:hypothetical protein [Rhodanobacter sp. Root627]